MSGDGESTSSWIRWLVGFVLVPIVVATIGAGALSWFQRSSNPPESSTDANRPATSPSGNGAPQGTRAGVPAVGKSAQAADGPLDPSPMGRCIRGEQPDVQGTSTFAGADPAATYPSPTAAAPEPPNVIRAGDVIQISASGSMHFAAAGKAYGPNGNGTPAPDGWLMPGVSQYSAVVRYNNNPRGWVGDPSPVGRFSTCVTYTFGYDIRLIFHPNTNGHHAGNSGSWSFTVKIYRG
jgi:hypothetical protein